MNGNLGHGRLRRSNQRRVAARSRRSRGPRVGDDRVHAARFPWLGVAISTLPGLAAIAAVLFTWVAVGQTKEELRIAEQGQITNRFNAAITNLGSKSIDVRLGGIYALQRIMQDSSRDHLTVVSVLATFVRDHAAIPGDGQGLDVTSKAPADIQAAMGVLGTRPPGRLEPLALDLPNTHLTGVTIVRPLLRGAQLPEAVLTEAKLSGGNLVHANLNRATLIYATLSGADLTRADLGYAYLTGAFMGGSRLANANLEWADIAGADLSHADLTSADLTSVALLGTKFTGANLKGVKLSDATRDFRAPSGTWGLSYLSHFRTYTDFTKATLEGSDLRRSDFKEARFTGARLAGADLRQADLTDADLTNADLTNADLTGADLRGARLDGAKRRGARGLPTATPPA